jgi:hypothetical protein
LLSALQEEGLMTPTVVTNCVNWFYDTAVRYIQKYGQICSLCIWESIGFQWACHKLHWWCKEFHPYVQHLEDVFCWGYMWSYL